VAATVPTAPGSGGRAPPYDIDAERGVIGSAILDGGRVLDLCVVNGLTVDSFYHSPHRILFEVLLRLNEAQEVVDQVSLCGRLREQGQLDAAGGVEGVERILDATPTDAHAEYYIQRVREKHLLRRVIDESRKAIEACYDPDRSVENILSETEQAIYSISDTRASEVVEWPKLVKGAFADIEAILKDKRGAGGISSGFHSLDQVMLGLRPGEVIVLAARPSMGKTSLAMNIAEHVATGMNPRTGYGDRTPRPVAVFSLEMTHEQLARRLLCCRARVNLVSIIKSQYLSEEGHRSLTQAVSDLQHAQILIDSSPGLEALDVRARARRLKKKYDVQLIVVDYLQLLQYSQFSKEGRQRETAAISSAMKAMARELNVPVLVLSQLNRASEIRAKDNTPRLADLRDSGAIEQDADVVMLLRRPCRMGSPDQDETLAYVDIAKHRNGPVGEVAMNFFEEFVAFEDRATGPDQEIRIGESQGGIEP
jgi:replicative DNA helicase